MEQDFAFKAFLSWMTLFVLTFFALAWVWVAKEPMSYHDPDYSVWKAKLALLERTDTRLVILGDSCAEDDLIPERLGPGVINLGSAGTTPIDTYFLAKKIVAGKTLPRAVVLSFVPFHFVNDTPDLFWARMTFDSLDQHDLNDIRTEARKLHDTSLFGSQSPGDLDARLKIFLLALKFPSFDGPALMKTILASRYKENVQSFQLTLASKGQKYRDVHQETDRLDESSALATFTPNPLIDDYFGKTLAFFAARGIPVYFMGMPHRTLSDPYYSADLKKNFAEYLKNYTTRFPNFQVLGNPLPCYPMRYFGDYSHLNTVGAPVWSDEGVELLNQAHADGGPYGASEKEVNASRLGN